MKRTVGVLVWVVFLLLASCGEPKAPPLITSAEELAGVRHRTTRTGMGGEVYRRFVLVEDGCTERGGMPGSGETERVP